MGSAQAAHLVREQQWQRGGMRVVILEPSAENRGMLQRELNQLPGFQLVGESGTWDECVTLLNLYLPELLITRIGLAPANFAELFGDPVFPVTVGLRRKDSAGTLVGGFETMDIPLSPQLLRAAMERARTEIYRRKLDELATLLQRYVNFSRGLPRYLTSIDLEDGRTPEIPVEGVIFMAAYGNYIRIHTEAAVHEIRDTMSAMKSKLDPAQFARVHRSFIVNRAHVTSVLRKEGTAICVLLSNSTEIPVGPNYREGVDSFEAINTRLSA
jgi:two-component system, LytTR family, response regulator